MTNTTPHPFPAQIVDETNYTTLAGITDENTRFIIRRAIADAYALGFKEGRFFEDRNRRSDISAARDAEGTSNDRTE